MYVGHVLNAIGTGRSRRVLWLPHTTLSVYMLKFGNCLPTPVDLFHFRLLLRCSW